MGSIDFVGSIALRSEEEGRVWRNHRRDLLPQASMDILAILCTWYNFPDRPHFNPAISFSSIDNFGDGNLVPLPRSWGRAKVNRCLRSPLPQLYKADKALGTRCALITFSQHYQIWLRKRYTSAKIVFALALSVVEINIKMRGR